MANDVSYAYNIDKLQIRRESGHVNSDLVNIGSYAEGCLCIVHTSDGRWETFIGQRSEKDELHVWDTEEDACIYFLGRVAWREWHD
ncbi:hypothetical protein [Frondihabitans australicus]|uniref:Uncharacterized protein n=1 Tax=Frondihabitans australicus TaxID=386892 RepID=A0A495IDL1_9MICO|nr:hypothetical protein [Frondihabitans australicus]RKR73939.1 hypothetical protein C8E83_1039 [Frondihabitans australicus]